MTLFGCGKDCHAKDKWHWDVSLEKVLLIGVTWEWTENSKDICIIVGCVGLEIYRYAY